MPAVRSQFFRCGAQRAVAGHWGPRGAWGMPPVGPYRCPCATTPAVAPQRRFQGKLQGHRRPWKPFVQQRALAIEIPLVTSNGLGNRGAWARGGGPETGSKTTPKTAKKTVHEYSAENCRENFANTFCAFYERNQLVRTLFFFRKVFDTVFDACQNPFFDAVFVTVFDTVFDTLSLQFS